MRTRRLLAVLALGVILFASGCACRRDPCCRRSMFHRMRARKDCCSPAPCCSPCSACPTVCGYGPDLAGPPLPVPAHAAPPLVAPPLVAPPLAAPPLVAPPLAAPALAPMPSPIRPVPASLGLR
jgi:hypothetical protein